MIKNNKAISVAIILLLLANILTLGIFWMGRTGQDQPIQQGPANYLIRELNLNPEQQKTYMKLVEEHRSAAEEIRAKIRESKDKLFGLLVKTPVSGSERSAAAASVSRNTEQLDLLTLNHFEQVRKLCDAEQQKKFDHIIQEVVRMMGRPHEGRHPGGPGMGGPPPGGPHEGPPPI